MSQILHISLEHDETTLDVFQYLFDLADSLYRNAKKYVNEISYNVSQSSHLFKVLLLVITITIFQKIKWV